MLEYLDGTDVTLVIPLVDSEGGSVVASSVLYRLFDGDDAEVVAETAVDPFVSGAESVTITIPGSANTMKPIADLSNYEAVIAMTEARVVRLKITTATGTITTSKVYGLKRESNLLVGVNTFQTLQQAMINSNEITDKLGWANGNEAQQTTALIEAHGRLSQLNFKLELGDMSRLSYKSVGSTMVKLVDITKAEYDGLPAKFRKALSLAQIAEADFILNADDTDSIRASGIIQTKVGETSTTFRDGKSLEFAVCSKAIKYLQRYVSFSASIGRA